MRHRDWNPKAFFRKISPTVIAQYEAAKGIVLIADRGEKADANQAYRAWQALPEGQRPTVRVLNASSAAFADRIAATRNARGSGFSICDVQPVAEVVGG